MSVISISLQESYKSALKFAIGSAIVEIFEASIAIIFGLSIEVFLRNHQEVQLIKFIAFVALGTYFILKKQKEIFDSTTSSNKKNTFIRGIIVALVNPQAIPFWLFALAFIAPYHILDFVGNNLYYFLGGVFIGKLMSLLVFAKGAQLIKGHINRKNSIINKAIGSIFIILGVYEVAKIALQ
jgi:threonine/homoserine/homoserine lactone efflux protein